MSVRPFGEDPSAEVTLAQLGRNAASAVEKNQATKTKKATQRRGFIQIVSQISLLDLTFFVVDVLTHNGVVLLHNHLFGHGPRVFLCHVKVPGPRGGVQADLDGGWLRHNISPGFAAAKRQRLQFE